MNIYIYISHNKGNILQIKKCSLQRKIVEIRALLKPFGNPQQSPSNRVHLEELIAFYRILRSAVLITSVRHWTLPRAIERPHAFVTCYFEIQMSPEPRSEVLSHEVLQSTFHMPCACYMFHLCHTSSLHHPHSIPHILVAVWVGSNLKLYQQNTGKSTDLLEFTQSPH